MSMKQKSAVVSVNTNLNTLNNSQDKTPAVPVKNRPWRVILEMDVFFGGRMYRATSDGIYLNLKSRIHGGCRTINCISRKQWNEYNEEFNLHNLIVISELVETGIIVYRDPCLCYQSMGTSNNH